MRLRGLKRDFGEVENLQVSVKGPGDFVTAAELEELVVRMVDIWMAEMQRGGELRHHRGRAGREHRGRDLRPGGDQGAAGGAGGEA